MAQIDKPEDLFCEICQEELVIWLDESDESEDEFIHGSDEAKVGGSAAPVPRSKADAKGKGKAKGSIEGGSLDVQDITVGTAEAAAQGWVRDDVQLTCGCHFHWNCFIDHNIRRWDYSQCPSCNTPVLTFLRPAPETTHASETLSVPSSSTLSQASNPHSFSSPTAGVPTTTEPMMTPDNTNEADDDPAEYYKLLVTITNEGGTTPSFDMGSVVEDEIAKRHLLTPLAHSLLAYCQEHAFAAAAEVLAELSSTGEEEEQYGYGAIKEFTWYEEMDYGDAVEVRKTEVLLTKLDLLDYDFGDEWRVRRALDCAVEKRDFEWVKWLLDNGASSSYTSKENKIPDTEFPTLPVQRALERGLLKIAALLEGKEDIDDLIDEMETPPTSPPPAASSSLLPFPTKPAASTNSSTATQAFRVAASIDPVRTAAAAATESDHISSSNNVAVMPNPFVWPTPPLSTSERQKSVKTFWGLASGTLSLAGKKDTPPGSVRSSPRPPFKGFGPGKLGEADGVWGRGG